MNTALFQTDRWSGRGRCDLRDYALMSLGRNAFADQSAESLSELAARFTDQLRYEWQRTMAEEILLLAQNAPARAFALSKPFLEIQPFGRGPVLKDLLDCKAAVSVIPLITPPPLETGALAHLWIVDGANFEGGGLAGANDSLQNARQQLWPVLPDGLGGSILDSSWQLGATLARLALADKDHFSVVPMLARDWIASGTVENEKVGHVKLENKLKLAGHDSGRNWLLPASSQGEETLDFLHATLGRLFHAHDVTTAWRHLTGHGVTEAPQPAPWPSGIHSMHCLVSDALGPMIAAFHHTQPEEIVLWVSTEMKERAQALQTVLAHMHEKGWLKARPPTEDQWQPMTSGNIASAEALLLAQPSLLSASKPVLFNVTGGNLLMRFAVNNVAQLNPRLALVYRDVDAKNTDFTKLDYPGRQGATTQIQPPANAPDDGWKGLLARMNQPPPYDADKVAKDLIAKISPALNPIAAAIQRNQSVTSESSSGGGLEEKTT